MKRQIPLLKKYQLRWSDAMPDSTIRSLSLPIRTLFCIGRNYTEHAKELGNPVPVEPVVFLKPVSAVCFSGRSIVIPAQSNDVHHEVEIVVALSSGGKDIPESRALECVAGYGIGIDVTARDVQEKAKQKGLPWSVAKGFDTFAALSDFVPKSEISDPSRLSFELEINGAVRQKGRCVDMIFSIPAVISYLSSVFTLGRGDLIYTGTPAGVGRLRGGDALTVRLAGAKPGTLELGTWTVRDASVGAG
jgi:2-keto-4-pentenoate hydratase/2-oxohepta-3-ene-1,7-dioic acid hydratase in catechol pathway